MTPLLWVLSLILVGVGMAGVLVPGCPDPSGFRRAAARRLGGRLSERGRRTIVILAVVTILAFGVDFVSASLGAKRAGASREALIGAALGTLIGVFFGFVGIVLGPFVGAVIGEFLARRNLGQAGRAGAATWIGFILGIGVKLVLAFTMVGIFVLAYIL